MNYLNQILGYVYITLYGRNINMIWNNAEILLHASKEICSEINTRKPNYMNVTRNQNQQQRHIVNRIPFEKVSKFNNTKKQK